MKPSSENNRLSSSLRKFNFFRKESSFSDKKSHSSAHEKAASAAKSRRLTGEKPGRRAKNGRKGADKGRVRAVFSFSPRTRVHVSVGGFNALRLLNVLAEAGIRVKNVQKHAADRMTIVIDKKDTRKTFAFCESMCYTYNVVLYEGLPAALVSVLGRVGAIAGCLLVVGCSLFLGSRCLRVETVGLNEVSRRDVLAAVRESGAGPWASLGSIDRAAVRRAVNATPGVAESSVELKGTTLVVTVIERGPSSEHVEGAAALVSDSDAVVTRVVVRSGTALVKAGDVVKAGDMLVEGVRYGSDGEKLFDVPAIGEVYGTVTFRLSEVVATGGVRFVRTGRSATKTSLKVCGLGGKKKAAPFDSFESETSVSVLNAFVPISATRTTYFETERRRDERTIEEIAEELARDGRAALVSEAENIRVATYTEQLADGLYKVTIYLEAEKKISTEDGQTGK